MNQNNHKVIVSQTKSLFWPVVWLFLFWPVGLLWLIFRLEYNFKIERSYAPIILLIGAIIFYVIYAWLHHDWTLSPISWLSSTHHDDTDYYYHSVSTWN